MKETGATNIVMLNSTIAMYFIDTLNFLYVVRVCFTLKIA